jgi:hypothetical protein
MSADDQLQNQGSTPTSASTGVNEHRLAHDVVMPLGMMGENLVFHQGSGDHDLPDLMSGEPQHEDEIAEQRAHDEQRRIWAEADEALRSHGDRDSVPKTLNIL